MSWTDVSRAFRTSWEKVFRSVQMAVNWGLEHVDLNNIKAIGIDEIQWHMGHRYLTLVYQIDKGRKRLLWIGQHRKTKTLLRFFRWFGKDRSAALQFVCTDMWKPYLKVIAKKASQAVNILDRFHIMSHMSKAIDKVRAGEARELEAKGYEPVLKGSRWLLLKRPENLTDKQVIQLKDLLRYNLKAVRSYLLKEDFQFFWDYISPVWAGRFMDKWCNRTMRSQIERLNP
jgi:transposase